MKKQKIENHKYIGFHYTKEVVCFTDTNKMFAEVQCEKLLLKYFHDLTKGHTLSADLEYYNGVVAYVGVKYPARK